MKAAKFKVILAQWYDSRWHWSLFSQLSVRHQLRLQRPNFQNFPKTFSKDLPMSDDLGISKKFSYPNFWRPSLRFQRTSSFLIFLN